MSARVDSTNTLTKKARILFSVRLFAWKWLNGNLCTFISVWKAIPFLYYPKSYFFLYLFGLGDIYSVHERGKHVKNIHHFCVLLLHLSFFFLSPRAFAESELRSIYIIINRKRQAWIVSPRDFIVINFVVIWEWQVQYRKWQNIKLTNVWICSHIWMIFKGRVFRVGEVQDFLFGWHQENGKIVSKFENVTEKLKFIVSHPLKILKLKKLLA